MASHSAFFYGTLMAPAVLHRVIWGSSTPPTPAHAWLLHTQPAILHGFQRRRVRHADYPAVVPAGAETSVRGTLVTGLTDGDVWRLDLFEGGDYARRRVRVRVLAEEAGAGVESGEECEAETYVWIAGEDVLEESEWDFAEFVRDKMARWVGSGAAEADEGFRGMLTAMYRTCRLRCADRLQMWTTRLLGWPRARRILLVGEGLMVVSHGNWNKRRKRTPLQHTHEPPVLCPGFLRGKPMV